MNDIIIAISGILIGSLVTAIIIRLIRQKQLADTKNLVQQSELEKNQIISLKERETAVIQERCRGLEKSLENLGIDLSAEKARTSAQDIRLAKAEAEYLNLKTKNAELQDLQNKFAMEFENLANKILKTHSKEFTEVNQKYIGDILNPLREKIQDFEKKVEDTYQKGIKDQTDLKAELKKLYDLNNRISDEAKNLTEALKSDTKKQGNWGELVLERVLENSGLTEGVEFSRQITVRNEQGEMLRPDVVVKLPDHKHIIIDSKVSLVAYNEFVNADIKEDKDKYLKLHLLSIRNHIKNLSEKIYHDLPGIDSPDFTLLFLPIESSFSIAIQEDVELFNFAWERKIVIVSPTTLLATLKTVASIWKQEKQTLNALEIAKQGGNLYDKFVAFLADLEKIGTYIDSSKRVYEEAYKKLSSGSGNLIGRVEKIKELGAKASKSIPSKYLDMPLEEEKES